MRYEQTCWYCGGTLDLVDDVSIADAEGIDDEEGRIVIFHCADCGAEVTYRIREED